MQLQRNSTRSDKDIEELELLWQGMKKRVPSYLLQPQQHKTQEQMTEMPSTVFQAIWIG
jgi:hypothetical protein